MRFKITVSFIFLCWAVLLSGCSNQILEGSQPVTLKLNWHHSVQFLGFYIAQEKGFYAQEGLEVTIEPKLETDQKTALIAAERIREAISEQAISTGKGEIQITISFGVSSLNQRVNLTLIDLIEEADQALYSAKKKGRNRTVLYQQEEFSHE